MTFSFENERMTAYSCAGIPMGFITFPRIRSSLVNISSVTVSPNFRGQGVEDAMMEALFSHLAEENQKAALTCPYAQQYVGSHPQWKHLLPGSIHFEHH